MGGGITGPLMPAEIVRMIQSIDSVTHRPPVQGYSTDNGYKLDYVMAESDVG